MDDLLLRHLRIVMLLPQSPDSQITRIQATVQSELTWDNTCWQAEYARYKSIYVSAYSLLAAQGILKQKRPF